MISIYASYFRQNGSIITDWTLIQKIPATDGELILTKPTVKCDMGNAESMDFAIYPGTPYFDAFMQMRSYIRVEYEDTSIFYGRVLTIENGYYGERRIHCEGALSILNDSQCPPVESNEKTEISILDHITQVIENHNQQLNDPYKTFYLGEIPGHYSASISPEQQIPNESCEYGNTGWTDTKAILEDMRSHYGGCFRTRFEDNKIYLDWMNHYFNSQPNSQIIEVGKNLIDLSDITEVSNIFTVIIPIGKSEGSNGADSKLYLNGYKPEVHGEGIYLRVPDICKSLNPESVYTDEELDSGYHLAEDYKNAINNYGYIFKPVEIQEATTQEVLFLKAAEWIKNNYQGGIDSFSIRAVDLHFLDPVDYQKILCGEQFVIRYPVGTEDGSVVLTERLLTCTAITYDLYNPENNQYSFGIPANMLTRNYATKSSKNPKDKISSPTYGGGGGEPELSQYDKWVEKVRSWLRSHKVWKKSTGGRESGPNAQTGARDDYNYFLYPSIEHAVDGAGRAWKRLWFPVYMSAIIKHDWVRDSQGRPIGNWSLHDPDPDKFDLIKLVNSHHLFEYIIDEYGIDLRNGLSVKMPSVTTDDEGNTTIWTTDDNGKIVPSIDVNSELGIKLLSMSGQNELVMDKFGNVGYYKDTEDGRKVLISYDIDGNLHYLDEDGNETNIRDLTITAYDAKDKVGWVVTENQQGEKEFANPGEMTMAIEKHNGGELVVTKLSGELMYLGNTKTDRIMTTSVQHMDQVTGDVEYVPDETDPTIKVFKINSGGGMRVNHGKKVLKNGPDGKPLDPNDPANWEYETRIDPETGEKVIVTADFGVYDNNNLVGGILSEKLNDGTVKTLIRGDVVDIKASQMASIGIYTDDHYDAGFIVNRINNGNQKINGTNINITSDQILISDAAGSDTLKSWMDDTDDDISEVTGSAIWRNRDQVTNVAGKFKFEQNPDGTTRMVIVSGGGLNIEKNNVQYGIYDSQTLTGGVVVKKLNDGSVRTTINGNALVFGDANTVSAEVTATELAKFGLVDANGQFTGGVVVDKLKDGTARTTINGAELVFGGNTTVSAEVTATELARFGLVDANGHFTGGLVASKLNDGTVTTTINGNALVFGDANTVTAEVTATELAKFGLVDANGHFTGGLIANKLNDGTVTTTINGNALVFGDANTVSAEVTATELAKFGLVDANGHFTGGLIANKLNDGTVTTNISGSIVNLQANSSFSAIISGSGANAAIKPAAIQAAIDSATGASKITLSADNVILDGDTTLHGAMSIDGSGQLLVSRVIGIGSTGNQTFINGNKIMSKDYQIVSGGKIIFVGSGTGEHYDLDVSTVSNMIKSVSVANNVLTITPFYGDPINFSKATSLSGAWSGGTYTVTAKQRNKNTETGQTVETTVATWPYSPSLRLNGNESDNFSAEITDTTGSTTIAVKSIYGYLAVAGSGASSSVKVYTNRSGSAGSYSYSNPVASLGVGSLYANGVTAGKNAVTINKGSWSGGIVSFTKSEGTASTKQVQLTAASATWNENTASVKMWDGTAADTSHGVDTGYTVTVDASGRYTAGVTAGKNAVIINKGSWSGGVISFTKSEGTASTKKVQLTAASATWSGNTASVKIWDGTAADTSHGVDTGYTVSVNATDRYNAGVTAGKNAVTINKGSWSSGVISFTKSEGTASTKKVQLTAASASWNGNTASVKIWDGTAADTSHGVDTGYTVTVDASGRYTAGHTAGVTDGKNAVTINKGSWSGGIVSFTKSEGTASTKKVQLTAASASWNGNTASVKIWDGTAADTSHGVDTGYTVTVDASGRYTAGVTAGKNAVTINKGSWSSGIISFTKSEGTASTKKVQLTAASATWSRNTASVKIWDGTAADTSHGVDTGYTVSVNATNRYNAGWNEVTISDGWSSNTYTVSASAKTDGTKREKSITVTAGISYDATTHKYTAKANAGGSERATATGGTQAYEAGISSVSVTNVGIYDGQSNLVSSNLSITSPISLWGGAKKNASGSYIWGSQVNITPVANVSEIGLYDTNSNPITSQTIYSAIDIWPGVSINNGAKTWGSKITISPPSFTFENPEIWTDAPGYNTKVTTTQYISDSKKYMAWVKINDSNYNGTEVTFIPKPAISIGSQQVWGSGTTPPWGSSGVETLNTMSSLVKANKNTTGIYFVFKVTAGESTKWYRFSSM